MAVADALAFCANDVGDGLRAGFHAKSSFGEMTRQARHGYGFDEKAAISWCVSHRVLRGGISKRSLDATKWNRGVSQHAHDRVGGSLDGGRRLVLVASVASMQRSGIEGCRSTPMIVSAVRSMAVGAWSW